MYRQQDKSHTQGLAELRRRLATECSLEAFKLPTLLKVVGHLEDIPVTETGKPIKNRIGEIYFSETAVGNGDVEVWTKKRGSDVGGRPFDWDGLQR